MRKRGACEFASMGGPVLRVGHALYGGGSVQRAANEVTALHEFVILSTALSMEQAS